MDYNIHSTDLPKATLRMVGFLCHSNSNNMMSVRAYVPACFSPLTHLAGPRSLHRKAIVPYDTRAPRTIVMHFCVTRTMNGGMCESVRI